MESPDERTAEPDWVRALLADTDQLDLPESVENGPTVRAEFARRVRRGELGELQEPVLRAGLAALDGPLGIS